MSKKKTFISENPYAIFTMNLDLQLTDVNPAFSKLSGYTTEELLRMKLTDFKVIRRDGPGVADAIKSGKLEGGKLIVQFPVGIRHVDYFYIPIKDPRGNIHKVIEIFLDRTDLVEQCARVSYAHI
jgi:PAS domain S-box-containing protein